MTENEISELEARLENWRACMRSGIQRSHCASAEHRYRQPPSGEALDARRVPGLLLDEGDAWRVEQAWRGVVAPFRVMLKCHYALCLPRHAVIRQVLKQAGYGLRSWHYRCDLHHALRLLKKELDKRFVDGENPNSQFESVSNDAWNESPKAVLSRPKETEPAQV